MGPDDAFEQLLVGTFQILLNQLSEEELLDQLSGVDALDAKRAFSSLSATMLDCARAGLHHSTVGEQLKEAGLSPDRSALAAVAYGENVNGVRSELQKTSFGNDRIIGIEWRVDYAVKSRYLEKFFNTLRVFIVRTMAACISNFRSSSMCLWVISISCFCSVFIGMLMLTRSFLFL